VPLQLYENEQFEVLVRRCLWSVSSVHTTICLELMWSEVILATWSVWRVLYRADLNITML